MNLKPGELKEATDGYAYSLDKRGIMERINLETSEVERCIYEKDGIMGFVNKKLLYGYRVEYDGKTKYYKPIVEA